MQPPRKRLSARPEDEPVRWTDDAIREFILSHADLPLSQEEVRQFILDQPFPPPDDKGHEREGLPR